MTNVETIALLMTIFSISVLLATLANIIYECFWRERMILEEFIKNEDAFIDTYTKMLRDITCTENEPDSNAVRAIISQIEYHKFVKSKLIELKRYRKAFDTIMYRVDLDKAYFEEHQLKHSEECEKELDRVKDIIQEYLTIDARDEE